MFFGSFFQIEMFLLSSFEEGFTSKEKNKRIYRFSLITKKKKKKKKSIV